MEEGREFKHACKFCNKSFPCGRSLGGHMRSHLINNSVETDEKVSNRSNKLSSAINNGGGGGGGGGGSKTNHEACFEAGPHLNYGLRENPKKTWRFADSSTEETSVLEDKSCKECGKGFQSWKALFGHMKRHSEKERASITDNNHHHNNNNSLEEQDSWTNSANQKVVFDSQSDNETTTPNRKRRSQRRTRYIGTTNSSSFSVVNNGSSSVSEIEQEQEEVALCLMMLSRDGNHWGGSKSVAESSDNFSESSKSPSSKPAAKSSGTNGSEISKSKKLNANINEAGKLDSGFSKFWSSMNGSEVKDKIKMKFQKDKSELTDQLGSKKYFSSSKRSLHHHAHYNPELRSDSLKKLTPDVSDPEICKVTHKRSKFECTTCNKIFHSYQALGGHRASHKKTKGCFASTIDSSENSIETDHISPEPTADDDDDDKNLVDHHDMPASDDRKSEKEVEKSTVSKKSTKSHECPICLKVFSSGQALGGHKRSHLIGANSDAKNGQTIVMEKPIPGIRDFLDLNLPAPDEEDSNGHVASLKPWWAGSSHKHEALVGLISN